MPYVFQWKLFVILFLPLPGGEVVAGNLTMPWPWPLLKYFIGKCSIKKEKYLTVLYLYSSLLESQTLGNVYRFWFVHLFIYVI